MEFIATAAFCISLVTLFLVIRLTNIVQCVVHPPPRIELPSVDDEEVTLIRAGPARPVLRQSISDTLADIYDKEN